MSRAVASLRQAAATFEADGHEEASREARELATACEELLLPSANVLELLLLDEEASR